MKREHKNRLNGLIKELQEESKKRERADLGALSRPYYYKGRFESLKPQQKREKIREYYRKEQEEIKTSILYYLTVSPLQGFRACVEWARSATWGANPHAKVIIENKENRAFCGFGSASGCGYDKLSAAICYACNDNEKIKETFLQGIIKKYIETGAPFPYGIYKTYKLYLHFDGCGVSTLREILKYIGLENWTHYHTKNADFINCY